MAERPKVENAPGVVWRQRSASWVAEWHARTDLVARGYRPSSVPLWRGNEPSEIERTYISDQANRLQTEMLVWGRGGIPQLLTFDGTLKGLMACYQTDADSTYRKLRYQTRQGYDSMMRQLERDHGDEPLADIKARNFLRWHEGWAAGGHLTKAHQMIGMLRNLFGFGATILESDECERLSGVLHRMRFATAKPRVERITAEQAVAIRNAAHEMGLHSIALAQVLQFECMFRQKDVIGEWVPASEPGISDVTAGGEKWLRGLRWSEIDQNLVLRHTTSKRQKDVEINLRLAPMVMEELSRLDRVPTSGPVIVSEHSGLPYTSATDAGAELEHVRHAATHSNITTTQGYSRGAAEKTAEVMKARIAHRNKPRTE